MKQLALKYIHIRKRGSKGEILPLGGITVGYEVNGGAVEAVYAVCCDKDNYNKRVGRNICENRYRNVDKKHSFIITVPKDGKVANAVVSAMMTERAKMMMNRRSAY